MDTRHIIATLAVAAGLAGCTSHDYDTGDGDYSYLRADFVEAHTAADKQVDYVDTDDGTRLHLATPFTPTWTAKADTVYRALLYYNNVTTASGDTQAEAVGAQSVPVLTPAARKQFDSVKTDPVTFESAWLSANKRYINLGLSLKTGSADDDEAVQTIGMVDDGLTTLDDGTRVANLVFYHDQGGVPEYYSSRRYVSISTSAVNADVVSITLNTYSGTVVKQLSLK